MSIWICCMLFIQWASLVSKTTTVWMCWVQHHQLDCTSIRYSFADDVLKWCTLALMVSLFSLTIYLKCPLDSDRMPHLKCLLTWPMFHCLLLSAPCFSPTICQAVYCSLYCHDSNLYCFCLLSINVGPIIFLSNFQHPLFSVISPSPTPKSHTHTMHCWLG